MSVFFLKSLPTQPSDQYQIKQGHLQENCGCCFRTILQLYESFQLWSQLQVNCLTFLRLCVLTLCFLIYKMDLQQLPELLRGVNAIEYGKYQSVHLFKEVFLCLTLCFQGCSTARVQPWWIQGIRSGDGVGEDQETTV